MCCFSGTVSLVSDTCIFARLSGRGTQYLVYQMSFQTDMEVAMVLPIPVSSHAENAVRFLALDGYPGFFDDLEELFAPPLGTLSLSGAPASAGPAMLEVHQVGNYAASFVPRIGDFDRLDPRFRLPEHVWEKLPEYADYGFAVFKLGLRTPDPAAQPEEPRVLTPWQARRAYLMDKFRPKPPPLVEDTPLIMDVHPMAFEFPTALPNKIFFPTLHIHDGMIHSHEEFDHSLYWQGGSNARAGESISTMPIASCVDLESALGVVDGEAPMRKLSVVGRHANEDIIL
ncbi:MAG: hypothetical protein ABIY70_12375 [Capsulimonas sp.]|uniref:hypothetical protein n=1 Tax=Capsulimonas sp. TaxID=2494211 RepID=UPI003262F326